MILFYLHGTHSAEGGPAWWFFFSSLFLFFFFRPFFKVQRKEKSLGTVIEQEIELFRTTFL